MYCLRKNILYHTRNASRRYRNELLDQKSVFLSQYQYDNLHERCKGALEVRGPSHLYQSLDRSLLHRTVGNQLDVAVEMWPNRECIFSVHQNVRLTFSELQRRASKLAAGFVKLGLKKDDKVCVWAPNCIEWYLAFLACSKIGLTTVGVNPFLQQAEIQYCLEKVKAKAAIAIDLFKSQNYASMLLNAKTSCSSLEHIILISNDHVTGTRRFTDVESLASEKEADAIRDMQKDVCPDAACNIQFTSGTTGKPKAVTLSHKSIVNNSMEVVQRIELHKQHNKVCLNVPFFHAFALLMGQVGTLHNGATLVLEGPSFNPIKSIETISREKCNVAFGTPTMWINMMEVQRRMKLPIQLSTGVTGGSPAAPGLFKNIRKNIVDNITSIYGLTEVTGIIFQTLPEDSEDLIETSIGHLSNHIEVLVVDDKGAPVPFETPGELWVRGYSKMMGYWGDEESTNATITEDGWLKTGDLFRLRQDGYGIIDGRLKDMIIRGGENIYPKEIEDFIMTHPAVLEVHVVGAHDDVYGEEVCACVKLKSTDKITADELKKYARGKIAPWKIPRYVLFVDSYPKTATGKIQKNRLREEIENKGLIPSKPKY